MFTDIVLVKCKICNEMLECVYDPGYAGSYNQPPEPAYWYSLNDQTLLPEKGWSYCAHEGDYTKEDFDDFQVNCGLIAAESFEIVWSDWW